MKRLGIIISVCLGLSGLTWAQADASDINEVLLRSFRLPKKIAVSPREFRELAEEQLCGHYYMHEVDGKKVVVPVKQWEENIDPFQQKSSIRHTTTVNAKMVPIEAKLEIIKAIADGEYRATQLEPVAPGKSHPLVFITVPDGVTYASGDIVECKLLPESQTAFEAELPRTLNTYRVLSKEEASRWWKASAKDLFFAYKDGATFLVKVRAHRSKCSGCDGTGVDQEEYEKIIEEIKAQKVSKRNMLSSDSTEMKLKKASRNKPKCEQCKGTRFFFLEEFRKLDYSAR